MGYRYIGSKARIAENIIEYIGEPNTNTGYFIDGFTGTGIVAKMASMNGWKVKINDMMYNAVVVATSQLLSIYDISFDKLGGYDNVIFLLNNETPIKGYIWKTYSPASKRYCGIERKYFTEENAMKIDSISNKIHYWKQKNIITENEFSLLISILISAVNNIANIAGTYGCFLSKWTMQSQNNIELKRMDLHSVKQDFISSNNDVFDVKSHKNDVVYFDPPYTKRQYASYYHILETISLGDYPVVSGVAGLRPWKEKASIFCYKKKALDALKKLILTQKAHRVILSYSNDGHIKLNDLLDELKPYGNVEIINLGEIGRYRPNKTAVSNKSVVNEFLLDFRKET